MIFEFTYTGSSPVLVIDFLTSIKPRIDWKGKASQGKIRVNGNFVGVHFSLKPADLVYYDPYLKIPEPPVSFDYHKIYEDEHLVIINKSTPLPIHPTGKYFHHSLTEALKKEGLNWYTINRIDSETSGILLLAKNKDYIADFAKALKLARKIYLVLVYGSTPRKFKGEMLLGKKLNSLVYKRQGENLEQGKPSLTWFRRVKENENNKSMLFAEPVTGRTHQIRAHLSELGYPVVGDKIYGKNENYFIDFLVDGLTEELLSELELPRQFLHAYKIDFIHPITGKRVVVKASLPSDLREYLEKEF